VSSASDIPASARVRWTWSRRIAAEYGSGALTLQLAHWLATLGAPTQLTLAAMDVARDELDHAERCTAVSRAAGREPRPTLAREGLAFPADPAQPLERAVLGTLVRSFCIGETLAVPLFRDMRDGCTVPIARATLDAILVDEARHREFAWIALDWLLASTADPGLRRLAERDAARMLALRIQRCSQPPEQVLTDSVTADERAWGLIGASRFREIVVHAATQELVPRFGRLGIRLAAPDDQFSKQ
jgi:hypothetical protein